MGGGFFKQTTVCWDHATRLLATNSDVGMPWDYRPTLDIWQFKRQTINPTYVLQGCVAMLNCLSSCDQRLSLSQRLVLKLSIFSKASTRSISVARDDQTISPWTKWLKFSHLISARESLDKVLRSVQGPDGSRVCGCRGQIGTGPPAESSTFLPLIAMCRVRSESTCDSKSGAGHFENRKMANCWKLFGTFLRRNFACQFLSLYYLR